MVGLDLESLYKDILQEFDRETDYFNYAHQFAHAYAYATGWTPS